MSVENKLKSNPQSNDDRKNDFKVAFNFVNNNLQIPRKTQGVHEQKCNSSPVYNKLPSPL